VLVSCIDFAASFCRVDDRTKIESVLERQVELDLDAVADHLRGGARSAAWSRDRLLRGRQDLASAQLHALRLPAAAIHDGVRNVGHTGSRAVPNGQCIRCRSRTPFFGYLSARFYLLFAKISSPSDPLIVKKQRQGHGKKSGRVGKG